MPEFDERRNVAEHWLKRYKYYFVVITCKDGSKATGVLQDLTPHNYLHITDKSGKSWEVDPLQVANFYARPDKFAESNGGDKHLP